MGALESAIRGAGARSGVPRCNGAPKMSVSSQRGTAAGESNGAPKRSKKDDVAAATVVGERPQQAQGKLPGDAMTVQVKYQTFKAGEMAVHPKHGVGEVTEIEERDLGGRKS